MKKRSRAEQAKWICKGGMLLGSGVILLFVLYYVIVVAKGYYHSDCTDTIMWAQAAWDAKALMNPDFKYACLLPFGGQLLMIPFVAMFGVSMKAQIIGMTLFCLLFSAAIIWLFRMLNWSYSWSAVALSAILLMCSSSEKMREIFWGHIIYYSLGLLFLFVGLALVLKILRSNEISWKRLGVFFIWTALCSMNGIQALTIYALPLLAAIIAERFFDFKTSFSWNENKSRYISIITMILAIVVGILCGKLANGEIVAGYAEGYSGFSDPSEWVNNALTIAPEYLNLIGVDTDTEMLLYSKNGILNLLRIIFGLILFVVPIIMAILYKKFEQLSYRILIWVHFALTTLIGLGWIVGTLNSANWRLIPAVVSSVILCIVFVHWIFYHTDCKRVLLIIVLPMLLVLGGVSVELVSMEKGTVTNRKLQELAQCLEDNGLEYGYATFWYSNIITLMSDSEVEVRTISLTDTGYEIRNYQTNIQWYTKRNGYKEYFVIMTGNEYQDYYLNPECEYPEAKEVIEYNGYYVLVYGENLF
jgi:hypothetical protein